MKVYVAGKWQDREYIRRIHSLLKEQGHEITLDWTTHDFDSRGVIATPKELAEIAIEDVKGALEANIFIGIMLQEHYYKGLWVEFGICLSRDIPILIVGSHGDSCIFMNHPNVTKLDSLEELIECTSQMAGGKEA